PAPPERQLWNGFWEETFENIAQRCEEAIHSVSPHAVIGLMTSAPQVQSAEGRRWRELLQKWAGKGRRTLCRPSLSCYREYGAREAMEGINLALMTKALVSETTRITPELETSPFTRFNKSATHIRLQMALSYFTVSPELTLDLHSFISPALDEE